MTKRNLISYICILLCASCYAQTDLNTLNVVAQAHRIVDTLASPYMGGRGYVDNGNQRAATYLNNQFKKLDLLHFGNSYEQKFDYPVNTPTLRLTQ